MSSVAEQLRLGREAKSLSIHQVAEVTKIRSDHVRAIEEGNFNVFSAPVYIRGFVRTYATLLKLDVPRIMSRLDEELGANDKFREPPPLTDHPRNIVDFLTLQLSKLDWRVAAVAIGAVVLIVSLIVGAKVWRHYRNSDPSANMAPGVYRPAPSGDTLPLPTTPPRGR
jgi:cytoskeletal protein RodZ